MEAPVGDPPGLSPAPPPLGSDGRRPGGAAPITAEHSAPRGAPGRLPRRLGPLVPSILLPALGLGLYTSSGRDDAYITYAAARSLARTGEILNYNGDRLEQSSSLLQTLLLAAAHTVTGASIALIGFVSAILFGILTVLGAQRLARELDPAAAAAAGFLTATSVYLVYWTFGGMETTLVSFTFLLVLIAALRLVRDPTSTRAITSFIVATSLFVVVRPESGFVLVATFGGFLVGWAALRRLSPAPGVPVRAGAILLAVPVIAWGAVTLWRVMYFGAPFPQPVGAKVGGLEAADGLAYAIRWLARPYVLAPLALLALSVIGLWRRADKPTALLWAAFGAQLGFVVLSGGGWMEGGRLLVPILPLAAVLIAVALVRLPRTALLVAAVVALQVVGVVHFAARDSTGTPAWTEPAYPGRGREAAEGFAWYERRNRVHLRDIVFLRSALPELRAIARRAEGPLTISTGQAGMVPYFLLERIDEDVRLIDLGSLTTDAFAACPPEGFRHTPLGSGVGYEYWLSHIDECRLPPPDVVYDVGPFEARTALEDGYTPVLQTPAAVIGSGSARFPGAPVSAEMFLAVRDGLLPNRSGT